MCFIVHTQGFASQTCLTTVCAFILQRDTHVVVLLIIFHYFSSCTLCIMPGWCCCFWFFSLSTFRPFTIYSYPFCLCFTSVAFNIQCVCRCDCVFMCIFCVPNKYCVSEFRILFSAFSGLKSESMPLYFCDAKLTIAYLTSTIFAHSFIHVSISRTHLVFVFVCECV